MLGWTNGFLVDSLKRVLTEIVRLVIAVLRSFENEGEVMKLQQVSIVSGVEAQHVWAVMVEEGFRLFKH